MLEAKEALESRSAGNIKREIRETVVESVSLLHSLILRLADSRSRAIAAAERVKALRYKDLEAQEVRHSRSLESITRTVDYLASRMDKVDGTTEAVRGIIAHDFTHVMEVLKTNMAQMALEIKKLSKQPEARSAPEACHPSYLVDLKLSTIKLEISSLKSARYPHPYETTLKGAGSDSLWRPTSWRWSWTYNMGRSFRGKQQPIYSKIFSEHSQNCIEIRCHLPLFRTGKMVWRRRSRTLATGSTYWRTEPLRWEN